MKSSELRKKLVGNAHPDKSKLFLIGRALAMLSPTYIRSRKPPLAEQTGKLFFYSLHKSNIF